MEPSTILPAATRIDWTPLLLVPALAAAALPLIGSAPTWITLTAAGLAMGMIIFIIASGLTLIFGLMNVLNFGHGVFIALGAPLLAPDRWLLWLGILFVLSVYFFPSGIVGKLRQWR